VKTQSIEFDQALIEKYNTSGPRYTSYPTAVQFTEDFGPDNLAYFRRLKEEGQLLPPEYPARLIVWLCTDEAAHINGEEADIYEPVWRERAGIG